MITSFVLKIKRAETPFYANLKEIAKAVRRISVPSWRPLHLPLYYFHVGVCAFFNKVYQGLWTVPLFRARCVSCGSGLRLPNGMPLVVGEHLHLYIGNDVKILLSTLMSGHVFDSSQIKIGNRVTIGHNTCISAAKSVEIGDDTVMADIFIADNDGHPLSPELRRRHASVGPEDVKPIKIGKNVWLGGGCYVLKGSVIGDNSIIAANSVVAGEIPANCVAAGSPAKVIKHLV